MNERREMNLTDAFKSVFTIVDGDDDSYEMEGYIEILI